MRIIKATRRPVKKNVGCAGKTYVLESKQALSTVGGRFLAPERGRSYDVLRFARVTSRNPVDPRHN